MPRLRLKIKDKVEDIAIDTDVFVVGRGDQCDFTIHSGFVSRRHCEISAGTEGYTLTDLDSKLGTFVNGEQVKGSRTLHTGDTIKFAGRLEAVFMADAQVKHTETLVAMRPDLQKDTERLVAVNGPCVGHEYPLHFNVIRIGRAGDNHVVVPVDTVSSYHAEITREGSRFVVRDLGSGNGTFVGEERISHHTLVPGEVILIDWVGYRFEHVHYRMESEGTRLHGDLGVPAPDPEAYVDRTLKMDAPPVRRSADAAPRPRRTGLLILGLGVLTAALLAGWWAVFTYLF